MRIISVASLTLLYVKDIDAVSRLKGGQADHRDLGLDVDRVSFLDGGNSHTQIGDGHVGDLATHQVGLLRGSTEPRVTQSTLGEQGNNIVGYELSRRTGVVLVALTIDNELQAELVHEVLAQAGVRQRRDLTVGQDKDGLDDLLVDTEITPSLTSADAASGANAGVILDLVHSDTHILDRIRSSVRPRRRNLRLVCRGDAIVIAVRLTIGSDSDSAGSESHHAHLLTTGTSALQQMHLVGKDTVHDRVNVCLIAGLENHVELLTELFVDVSALLEEGHFGLQLVKADTRTGHSTHIKRRGLEDNRQTVRTLDPVELQAEFLVGGEQLLTEVGRHVLSVLFPVSSELRSLDEVKNSHCVVLLSYLLEELDGRHFALTSSRKQRCRGSVDLVQINEAPNEQRTIGVTISDINIMQQHTRSRLAIGSTRLSRVVYSLDKRSVTRRQTARQGSASGNDLATVTGDGITVVDHDADRDLILNVKQNLDRCSTGGLLDTSLVEH
nr:MAG TPA: hypothetical protein [Podoviridae sp. ctgHy19]